MKRPGDSSRGGRKWLLEGARYLLPPGTENVTGRNGLGHDRVFRAPTGLAKSQDASGGLQRPRCSSMTCTTARRVASWAKKAEQHTPPNLTGKCGGNPCFPVGASKQHWTRQRRGCFMLVCCDVGYQAPEIRNFATFFPRKSRREASREQKKRYYSLLCPKPHNTHPKRGKANIGKIYLSFKSRKGQDLPNIDAQKSSSAMLSCIFCQTLSLELGMPLLRAIMIAR